MMKWLKSLFGKGHPISSSETHVKQELHATVILACSNCGAAGVDAYGKDVGTSCPNCGSDRPKNKVLGQIWRKVKDAN